MRSLGRLRGRSGEPHLFLQHTDVVRIYCTIYKQIRPGLSTSPRAPPPSSHPNKTVETGFLRPSGGSIIPRIVVLIFFYPFPQSIHKLHYHAQHSSAQLSSAQQSWERLLVDG